MRLIRTIAPTELPVTLEDIKADLRIVRDDEDGALLQRIEEAVDEIDGAHGWLNGRALMRQTWEMRTDRFPGCGLELLVSPVQTLTLDSTPAQATTVQYLDPEGDTVTLPTESWRLVGGDDPMRRARVVLADGASWPATASHPEAVIVTYVAGFSSRDEIPRYIRALIIRMVRESWNHRTPLVLANFVREPAFRSLFELSSVPVRL